MDSQWKQIHPLCRIIALFSAMVLLCYTLRAMFVEMLTFRDMLVCSAATVLGGVGALWPAAAAASCRAEREAIVRKALRFLFFCYLACLVGQLFTVRLEEEEIMAKWREIYLENWDTRVNFTPFQTVRRYLRILHREDVSRLALKNLLGNMMLLTPMAVLAPCLYPRLQSPVRFSLLSLLLLLTIEGLQLLFRIGICDVDDVILNFTGAMITFALMRLPFVQRWLRRLCILPEEGSTQASPGDDGGKAAEL